jgi:hypothetical protein
MAAIARLLQMWKRGSYRVIRDPEGEISIWTVVGKERQPFSICFVERGRVSGRLEAMSPEFVRAFLAYVETIP